MRAHEWNDEFCSCGQDSVTCQGCGKRVCGTVAVWMMVPTSADKRYGNVGPCCCAKYGLGHMGTEAR